MTEHPVGQAFDSEDRALIGGGQTVPGPVQDIVRTEGVEDREESDASEVALWLFSPEGTRRIEWLEITEVIRHPQNLLWIDLSGYRRSTLDRVERTVGLDHLAVEAAETSWQRPRLQMTSHGFFTSVTLPHLDNDEYRVTAGELDIFVGRNFLVTAHRLTLPFAQRILARGRISPELIRLDSAYMLYIVLDEFLAYYEDLYESIQNDIDLLEERALTDSSDDFLEDLVRFKRYVTALGRLAEQHRQLFAVFLRPDFHFVTSGEVDTYYRDLETRLARLLDMLGAAREAATSAFDVYVSQVSHRTNQIIKVLTIVSSTLLPINVAIAFFGTSFRQVPIYGPTSLVILVVLAAVVLAGSFMLYFRSGWL